MKSDSEIIKVHKYLMEPTAAELDTAPSLRLVARWAALQCDTISYLRVYPSGKHKT